MSADDDASQLGKFGAWPRPYRREQCRTLLLEPMHRAVKLHRLVTSVRSFDVPV